MSPSTFFVAAAAALVVAASAADPIKFDGYAVDVKCVSTTGSKSLDKGVSVLAKPEEHTKYCLMMSVCIKDLVLLEAPATTGSDYTIKYHLAADLLAVVAAQIQASTKTADIKVQVEGCLTGATTDVTPGGGAKQSVPVLGKCPADATTTAAPGATTTAATDMSSDRLYSEKCKNAGGNQVKCMRTAGCVKTGGPPGYSPTLYTYCHLIDCAAKTSCEDCAYAGCGWQQGKCQDVPGGSKQGASPCPIADVGCWTVPDMATWTSPSGFCTDDFSNAPAAGSAGGTTTAAAGGNGAPGLAASIAAVLVGAIAAMFF